MRISFIAPIKNPIRHNRANLSSIGSEFIILPTSVITNLSIPFLLKIDKEPMSNKYSTLALIF